MVEAVLWNNDKINLNVQHHPEEIFYFYLKTFEDHKTVLDSPRRES